MGIKAAVAIVALALSVLPVIPAFGATEEESLSYTVQVPPTKKPQLSWGRDLFVPLVRRGVATDLRLTAIFYNNVKPSAIINGNIVYIGGFVNGQKVIDIGKTHVILLGESGRIRLDIAGLAELGDGAKQKQK